MKNITETTTNTFLDQLKKYGEEGMFKNITNGWLSIPDDPNVINSSELKVLELSDSFFSLYRRTGIKEYATIGRVFRKAAHYIYRANLRKNIEKPLNLKKFLNLISVEDLDGY